MDLEHIADALANLGCPAAKTREMAAQLDKRARQLSAQRGGSYEQALLHLLALMREGMSANPPSPTAPPAGKDEA